MTLGIVLFLAALQGVTELFPVSSLGHSVVVPALLHFGVDTGAPTYVPFLALLHIGTGLALVLLYFDQWVRIVRGFVAASIRGRITTSDERLAMLLVVGTVPAGLVGVALEHPLKSLFGDPRLAAAFLIVNGALLFGAELLRRRSETRATSPQAREAQFAAVEQMSFVQATLIGLFQVAALVPGISRSGVTMAGGLVAGLRHQEAVRFALLLATPIILAAGVLEIPQLVGAGVPLGEYVLGAALAGILAYGSGRFLVRYFTVGRLDPFAAYCAALGAASLVILR